MGVGGGRQRTLDGVRRRCGDAECLRKEERVDIPLCSDDDDDTAVGLRWFHRGRRSADTLRRCTRSDGGGAAAEAAGSGATAAAVGGGGAQTCKQAAPPHMCGSVGLLRAVTLDQGPVEAVCHVAAREQHPSCFGPRRRTTVNQHACHTKCELQLLPTRA